MNVPVTSLFAALIVMGVHIEVFAAVPCESLSSLVWPSTRIDSASSVAAGGFTPPTPFRNAQASMPILAARDIPAFCRVAARVAPSSDSDIKFEVWMPISGWNGKFLGIGNGGWGGEIRYDFMGEPLSRGYSVAATDTGHPGTQVDASFAIGHPEKVIDFGYRAVHEMTLIAKAVVAAYYGEGPRRSYWNGCSTGGRQGLTEAQRFPTDFDGIIAGSPANNFVHMAAHFMWIAQAAHKDDASYIPPAKHPLLRSAVQQACDARDGVKDGVLEDPRACTFDPQVLACAGGDQPTCLTASQVELARRVYVDSMNPRTKEPIYPGLLPRSDFWTDQAGPQPATVSLNYWRHVVFQDPNWDYKTLNFDGHVAQADALHHDMIAATDPNLMAFFERGGKLLQYHGWADPGVSPLNSVNYYERVLAAVGGARNVSDSYRLFMMPGVAHCRSGDGPDTVDALTALEQWVEEGKAPDRLTASRFRGDRVDRTRPLCPYPQVAVHRGAGSTDEATNFECKIP